MSNHSLAKLNLSKRSAVDSKNKIRNVALRLFVSKGIKSSTTREIAKKAGISEGTIYKHFESKDELALELFITNMDMFREKLLENITNNDDPKEILSRLIQNFFDFAKKQPEAYSYIMDAHYTELKKIPKERPKPKDPFVEAICLGIEKGDFRKLDENLGAALVIGMITRTILFFNNGFINLDYYQAAEEVVYSAIKLLGAQSLIIRHTNVSGYRTDYY
ncbi:MAG: TetR/AcrR family transcriptional regulator [Deltaproteobacteria bacterium]|nr:TetR/AcrR family transcriptional regulator [Deltaproteobacteria bacterium]